MIIVNDLVEGFEHHWVKRVAAGRTRDGQTFVKCLPRIIINRALRIIAAVASNPENRANRDRLASMIKDGLGVRADGVSADWLRSITPDTLRNDQETRDKLSALLNACEETVLMVQASLAPWNYLPSAEWVEQGIGFELWEKFFHNSQTGTPVPVPVHASPAVLIYRQDGYGSDTYVLRDSYILSRKRRVGIPSLFIHTDAAKKNIPRNIKVKTKNRKTIALFGVFYFEGCTKQEQMKYLNQCIEADIDPFETVALSITGDPVLSELNEKNAELRAKLHAAKKICEQFAAKPPVTPKGKQRLARAQAILKEQQDVESEIKSYRRKLKNDNPVTRIKFHALDLLVPTNFRPTVSQWEPIRTAGNKPLTDIVQRLIPPSTDLTTELAYNIVDGNRIW